MNADVTRAGMDTVDSALQRQDIRNEILCIGSIMVDMLCPVAALPLSGEGAIARGVKLRLGGCAFNTACVARYAGADCRLFAPVGTGPFASFVRSELEAREMSLIEVPSYCADTDIATDAAVRGGAMCGSGTACGNGLSVGCGKGASKDNGASCDNGVALCLIEPDGERTMITIPGIERSFNKRWFAGVDTTKCVYAVVCGYEIDGAGGDAIIDFLEENPHMETVFAPGPPIMRIGAEKMARMIALRPLWHLNERELCTFMGCDDVREAARGLSRRTENAVVVTLGPAGALVCDYVDGNLFEAQVPAQPVDVVDTVGAGDSHVGALLARRIAGDTWEEALAYANHVSGLVCSIEGGELRA